jgi:hypothetical protein
MIMSRVIAFACDRWETDDCFETIETNETRMRDARAEARRAGWLSTAALDLCPKHASQPTERES